MEHDANQLWKEIRERLKADFDFHERHDRESKCSLFGRKILICRMQLWM
jgi:hypothetical protein